MRARIHVQTVIKTVLKDRKYICENTPNLGLPYVFHPVVPSQITLPKPVPVPAKDTSERLVPLLFFVPGELWLSAMGSHQCPSATDSPPPARHPAFIVSMETSQII